jgi:RNA polymerase-binding transcription factor DksA
LTRINGIAHARGNDAGIDGSHDRTMDADTRSHLNPLRQALLRQRRALGAGPSALDDAGADDVEVSDTKDAAEQARESLAAEGVERVVRHELADIEAALARLASGEYGVCLDCGDDIPYARLRVQPAAARCADCQGEHERRAGTSAP